MTYAEPAQVSLTEERPSVGRAFLAGLLLLVLTAALLPLNRLSPYKATLLIGLIGGAGLFWAVYFKYHGRLTFNAETAFLAVLTLQYLIAPVITRILSDDFNWAGQTGERAAVKDGYGGAMLICLLYAGVFLIVGALMPRRAPVRLSGGALLMSFSRRTYLVVIYGAVMLWLTRMALLATGSFYHLSRSRFQFEDPRYSAWVQYDRGMGPVIVAFACATMLTGRLNKALAIGYILLDLFWNFASGAREPTIIVALAVLATVIVYRNRIPWKLIIISSIPGLLLLGFMDYYRYALRETQSVNTLTVGGIIRAIDAATQATESKGIEETILRGVSRVNDLDSVAAMYTWVPKQLPYQGGETYTRILPALVPRAFWRDKPKVMMPINEFFFLREGGTSPTTTMGEGWLNFGVAGVVLAGVLSAVLLHFTESFIVRFLWNAATLPVYVGAIAILSRLHTQPMAVWVTTVPKMMLLVLLIHLLTRPRRPGLAEEGYIPDEPPADPYDAKGFETSPLEPHTTR